MQIEHSADGFTAGCAGSRLRSRKLAAAGVSKNKLGIEIMEMIIAELHEQSRSILRRAQLALLAARHLDGVDLPVQSEMDRAATAALSTAEAVLKEVHAVRPLAVSLKMAVLDHVLVYPTASAWHRRLARACEASAEATEAEAIVTRLREGAESRLAKSVLHQSQAFREEAEAHWELASKADKKLSK